MKNITTTAQAIDYAHKANLTTVIIGKEDGYSLDEYTTNKWSVFGEYGWHNTREEVEAMKFVRCELLEEEAELWIIVEDTGW